jgi:flagella basal body P-ring formation protein FlgA
MNLDSRNTISGMISESGAILVGLDRAAHRKP